jgi:hypothetical protein
VENLLAETLETLTRNGKSPADVRWVGSTTDQYSKIPTHAAGSWDEFAALADFKYDDGYGGNEIVSTLVIVGDDWWLERGEYDGSEWWEYKTLPKRAVASSPLRLSDLKDKRW